MMLKIIFFLFCFPFLWAKAVLPGIDILLEGGEDLKRLKDKRIALITNQTGVNSELSTTLELLRKKVNICALFSPEHGFKGQHYASESLEDGQFEGLPIYSLYGKTRRPQPEMLENIDVLIYDIQCAGMRAYTYPTTLFYAMEEAVKFGIEVIVLDRPNPINGITVDGPMLEEKWRSYIGYINVPYCHGMTIGELASFFNEEYNVGCKLNVIPMKGWSRWMSYRDTGLSWIPPSPNIPEPDTPLYCPSTGIAGELGILSIGIGFTLPFKVIGAPWIDAHEFAEKLNDQKLAGVHFQPFSFRPYLGNLKGINCEGVLIHIKDPKVYKPLSIQFLLLGMLKSLYPKEFCSKLKSHARKDLFCKAVGTDAVFQILLEEKYPTWKLIELHQKERESFLEKRKKYLIYD